MLNIISGRNGEKTWDSNEIPLVDMERTVKDEVNCSHTILRSLDGELEKVFSAPVGRMIYHRWECTSKDSKKCFIPIDFRMSVCECRSSID